MRKSLNTTCTLLAAFVLSAASVSLQGAEGWFRLYFSPGGTDETERGFIAHVDAAKKSLHGAFYKIASKPVAESLIRAHRRGVEVSLVTESDNMGTPEMQSIRGAGIPVKGDGRRGLMHNKFAVFDANLVWTGSYNLSGPGGRDNDNNVITIASKELAQIFEREFREMFEQHIFGNRKEEGVLPFLEQGHHVRIDGTDINVYFSPDDDIERIVLARLKKAHTSVYFMAFSFTSDPVAEAMIAARKRGVEVRGVMEADGTTSRESEYVKLSVEGIPVRLDGRRGDMHHKVMILDGRIVITGSYNFSRGANLRNDENMLIIDNEAIASEYMKEFSRLFDRKRL